MKEVLTPHDEVTVDKANNNLKRRLFSLMYKILISVLLHCCRV